MASNFRHSASSLAPHPPLRDYYQTEEQREQLLATQFDHVAHDYNWITQASSFGSGKWYRREALKRSELTEGNTILDVACGPGTVSVCAQHIVGETGRVIGLDPSLGMVTEAQKQGVSTVLQGKAEHLPFPDSIFDFISMGYALRHVTDLTLTFKEYLRVLKPGGRFVCLEFSRPVSAGFRKLYDWYSFHLLPWIGTVVARDGTGVYEYLPASIRNFPNQQRLCEMLKDAGFETVDYDNLTGGIVAIHVAVK